MSDNYKWWDQFYTDMEKGLAKYTRPSDWKERASKAETRRHKPVRNQFDGRTGGKPGQE